MTRVIGAVPCGGYPRRMLPVSRPSALASWLRDHRMLEARLAETDLNPPHVLMVGHALLAFADREAEAFTVLLPLLDPTVRVDLAAEHHQLDDDLALLEWLIGTTPDSPDVPVLGASLIRRLRLHAERDGRLLERAERLRTGD